MAAVLVALGGVVEVMETALRGTATYQQVLNPISMQEGRQV